MPVDDCRVGLPGERGHEGQEALLTFRQAVMVAWTTVEMEKVDGFGTGLGSSDRTLLVGSM